MLLRRLPPGAALAAAALSLTTSVAAADPPWSPPASVPGVGDAAAAATPSGSVVALTLSDRRHPPGTASQLLRLNPADGTVRSAAGIDLAGAQIAAYGSDHVAVAGTSIGPSGTVDEGEASDPAVVSFATAAPGHGFGPRRIVETVGVTGPGRFVGARGSASRSRRATRRCSPGPASTARTSSPAPPRSPGATWARGGS